MVPMSYLVGLSAMLFTIGVAGVLLRRNTIVIFMSIEIMLNAVNLAFVALGRRLGSMDGQVIVFFVMTVAAAEAAVGLAIIITRCATGFSVRPLMASYFIPCVGPTEAELCEKIPDNGEAWSARSLWLSTDRAPDETAVAIYRELWFSSAELPADA